MINPSIFESFWLTYVAENWCGDHASMNSVKTACLFLADDRTTPVSAMLDSDNSESMFLRQKPSALINSLAEIRCCIVRIAGGSDTLTV